MNSLTTSGLNTDLAELPNLIGARLGPTEWVEATQEQVNCFAELTGDRNFLHVDPERARSTPFGGTISRTGFYRSRCSRRWSSCCGSTTRP